MEYELEISAEVDTDLDSLIKLLEGRGFKLQEIYDLDDIYLINKNDYEDDYYDMLNKCVLLRHMTEESGESKTITYKYKEYNDKKEIINQGKVAVEIDDIDKAKELFERLNFEELIRIKDHILVYATDREELIIQNVNNKHIYVEVENNCYYIKKEYNSIDDLKNVIINNHIPIKNNDFFVKKAIVELKEKFNNELKRELKKENE